MPTLEAQTIFQGDLSDHASLNRRRDDWPVALMAPGALDMLDLPQSPMAE